MQIILNTPMVSQATAIVARAPLLTADEITHLRTGLLPYRALAVAHANRPQAAPLLPPAQPRHLLQDGVAAALPTTMTPLLGLVKGQLGGLVVQGFLQTLLDVLQQLFLVALDRQDVVAAPSDDSLGNLLLAAHRVDADQSPLQLQQLQQPGNGRDFVGIGGD